MDTQCQLYGHLIIYKSKHSLNSGEDCMKKFCIILREHAANAINFEEKKMSLVTEEELKLHKDSTIRYNCRKKFTQQLAKDKHYRVVRDHRYYTGKYRDGAHSICNLRFNVPNEILVVFLLTGSNYYYHFIVKELANEFKDSLNVFRKIL